MQKWKHEIADLTNALEEYKDVFANEKKQLLISQEVLLNTLKEENMMAEKLHSEAISQLHDDHEKSISDLTATWQATVGTFSGEFSFIRGKYFRERS